VPVLRQERFGMELHSFDGEILVLFNDSHSDERCRASLMEEYFHLRLGHPPVGLRILNGLPKGRGKDPSIEQEAYSSGAAALLPFKGLRKQITRGRTVDKIAEHYVVSRDLVRYRAKVTKLYRQLS